MKIGLIAMSGIRACNKDLMAFGLTLPGFVERSKVIASLPSLGLLTLAGMTPPDVEIEYVEVPDISTMTGLPCTCDVAAIASFTAQIRDAYTLADRYRAAGIKVVLGGLHVSAVPDEAGRHADAVVIGEGEVVWPKLVEDAKQGQLQSVYDARGKSFDLADAPMPRFELLDPEQYNRLTVQTQRGCSLSCDFCASSILISQRFKIKPVAKVLAEIHRIQEIWKHPFIEFADDNTFVDKRHSKELVAALVPEGIKWFTETDISVAEDVQLLKLMRESSCAQILIGLESPVSEGLDGIERHSNWKMKQFPKYRDAIARIQDHGITVNGCFVLGLDRTDATSFEKIYNFVNTSGLFEVQITFMTPFPGTPLYERLRNEGRILCEGAWERCTLFDINFQPQQMSVDDLEHGFRELATRLYSAEAIADRRKRFFDRQRVLQRSTVETDS